MDEPRDTTQQWHDARLRDYNDRVRDALLEFQGGNRSAIPLVCECSLDDCDATLVIEDGEYAYVRSTATWLVVAPEHASADADRVLERHDGHWVIEHARRP